MSGFEWNVELSTGPCTKKPDGPVKYRTAGNPKCRSSQLQNEHKVRFAPTIDCATESCYQTWNWVIGSPGQWVIWVTFHVRVTLSPGHHFDSV